MSFRHFVSAIVIFVAGFMISAVIDREALHPFTKSLETMAAAQGSQVHSTSQRWEYRVVIKNNSTSARLNDREVSTELNQLGEQGFEVWQVNQSGTNEKFQLAIVLRRPR